MRLIPSQVWLPSLPDPQPLSEVVLFAFDRLAFAFHRPEDARPHAAYVGDDETTR